MKLFGNSSIITPLFSIDASDKRTLLPFILCVLYDLALMVKDIKQEDIKQAH